MYYGVLRIISNDYPPHTGTLLTRYSPFRRSPPDIAIRAAPRLACVKPAASVHPEPGSNSSLYILFVSPALGSPSKESSLALQISLLQYSCLYFCLPIIQSTCTLSPKGTAKIRIFSFLPNLFKNIFWLAADNKKIYTFAPVMGIINHIFYRVRVRR